MEYIHSQLPMMRKTKEMLCKDTWKNRWKHTWYKLWCEPSVWCHIWAVAGKWRKITITTLKNDIYFFSYVCIRTKSDLDFKADITSHFCINVNDFLLLRCMSMSHSIAFFARHLVSFLDLWRFGCVCLCTHEMNPSITCMELRCSWSLWIILFFVHSLLLVLNEFRSAVCILFVKVTTGNTFSSITLSI